VAPVTSGSDPVCGVEAGVTVPNAFGAAGASVATAGVTPPETGVTQRRSTTAKTERALIGVGFAAG
jgi:hypothetical protein